MTEPPATSHGIVTRLIHTDIGPVIPVIDLADKIGYGRSSLSNIIDKNTELFEGFTIYETLQTTGGPQRFLCVNSTGADRLLLLLKPAKNRKEIFEKVEAFRTNAFGRLAEAKKEIVAPDLNAELREARTLAETCGKSPEAFQAAILRKYGKPELADALQVPAVPSLIHGERGWYNASQLAEMCGIDRAEYVNNYLHNRGWIYRDAAQGRVWRLQPQAMDHGREYWFEAPSGHREVRLAWRESILVASGLRRETPDDQMALPARAGGGA